MSKHIVSFSGGMGSAVSAILAHEMQLDYDLVFADTRIEDEDLYRFNRDVAARLGKELVILSSNETPWDVFVRHRYIGNTRTAHCSTDLKTNKVRDYMSVHYNNECTLVLGMGVEESDRLERAKARWSPVGVKSLLAEAGVGGGSCLQDKLAEYDIKPPRLYDYGFPHNNCGGFCCKAGLKQFKTLLTHFPKRFAEHEASELEAMRAIGPTARPFLRRTVAGEQQYITLKEFRQLVESGNIDIKEYDFGGCGCFVDM
jgi:hypothetical protein